MAESRCSILLIDNGAHALLPTSNRAEEVHTSRKRGQKSEENDDDLCEGKDMEILKVLKPLYISMACFVLHWTGKDTWFSKKRCYFDGFTVHCCFMLCLGWFWFAASFIGYQNNAGFGAWLIRHVLNQIFCIQIACGITGNVYQRHKHIIHFYALWNRYKIKYGGASYDYMRKRVLVWVILIDVVLLCFTVFDTVIIFIAGYEVEVHPVSTTLEKLFPNVRSSYFIIAVLLALNYSTIAWLQIIIFITQVNYLLKLEFKELTKQFANEVQLIEEKQAIESSENRSLKNNVTAENLCDVTELDMLEIYRKRHLQLCRLVNHFDDASSIFIILLYFLNIPLTVFSVYGMMGFGRSSENAIMTWIYVEVVAYFIIMVLVITISSARLAAAVSVIVNSF